MRENKSEDSTTNPIFNPVPCTEDDSQEQVETKADGNRSGNRDNIKREFQAAEDDQNQMTRSVIPFNENLGKDVILVDRKAANLDPNKKDITILIVGDSNAGKSSFVHWFQVRTFMVALRSTLGIEPSTAAARVGGQHYLVTLMDTAGQERFHSIPKSWYRNADGAIVMYDITEYESLQHVTNWKQIVDKNCMNDGIPYILVGNKVDLENKPFVDGKQIAKCLDMAGYFETSAKTGEGVDIVMQSIIGLAVNALTSVFSSQHYVNRQNVVKLQVGPRHKAKKKGRCC